MRLPYMSLGIAVKSHTRPCMRGLRQRLCTGRYVNWRSAIGLGWIGNLQQLLAQVLTGKQTAQGARNVVNAAHLKDGVTIGIRASR